MATSANGTNAHFLQNNACIKDSVFGCEGIHTAVFLCYGCNAFCAKAMILLRTYRHVVNKHDRAIKAVGEIHSCSEEGPIAFTLHSYWAPCPRVFNLPTGSGVGLSMSPDRRAFQWSTSRYRMELWLRGVLPASKQAHYYT